MNKESLFELIRNEEVIVWAGAGFSLYAGFPSGTKLVEILYDNLNDSEKKIINPVQKLPDLSEEIFRIKGHNKNFLFKVLTKAFINFSPKSTEYHDKLAKIPHIKSVLTTNYDRLLENSYGSNGQVIINSNQVAYLEKEKTQIFKVHGDLSDNDTIILTSTDYNNFFKMDVENNPFWTVIKEKLLTKCILFLGYNLEDPNISVIFDKIYDALSYHTKEMFLVAPNLIQHKVNDLRKRGIQYINATAEEIIDGIIENLKKNIIDDFNKGKISSDTFRIFLKNFNLFPSICATNDSYKLKSINSLEGEEIKGKVNFSTKDNEKFIKELNAFITGKIIGRFEIIKENLDKAEVWIGGLRFPIPDNINKIILEPKPISITKIDLRFEDGFELTDLPVKTFRSNSEIEFHIQLKSAILTVTIDIEKPNNTKFSYKHHQICGKVKEEIDLFTLLKKIGEGQKFTVFPETEKPFTQAFLSESNFQEGSHFPLIYFEKLKKIENHYKIRFNGINIESINEEEYKSVSRVVSVINEEGFIFKSDEIHVKVKDAPNLSVEHLKIVNDKQKENVYLIEGEETIEIHGQKIYLGWRKIEILESFISNLTELINQTEDVIKIKSKINRFKVTYIQVI